VWSLDRASSQSSAVPKGGLPPQTPRFQTLKNCHLLVPLDLKIRLFTSSKAFPSHTIQFPIL
jgi:hypothetical protein